MIKFKIDISQLTNRFTLTQAESLKLSSLVVSGVTDEVERNWRELAHENLHSTRSQYLRGLMQPELIISGTKVQGIITLVGQLPNMIESGAPAFDMKTGFMKGAKVKVSKKGGWYTTVPFRFATPGALGENEAFTNVMPKAIYQIVKELDAFIYDNEKGKLSRKTTVSMYGGALSKKDIPAPYDAPKTRKAYGEYGSYTHKHSIYEGMRKEEKTYEKSTQSQYISFRRISNLSDPNSWIHPGFQALNLGDKALVKTEIDVVTENIAAKFLEGLGF